MLVKLANNSLNKCLGSNIKNSKKKIELFTYNIGNNAYLDILRRYVILKKMRNKICYSLR